MDTFSGKHLPLSITKLILPRNRLGTAVMTARAILLASSSTCSWGWMSFKPSPP